MDSNFLKDEIMLIWVQNRENCGCADEIWKTTVHANCLCRELGICWATHQDAGQPAYSAATVEVKRVESAQGFMTRLLISENGWCRETPSLHIISWHSGCCLCGISFRLHWGSWAGHGNSAQLHVQIVALGCWLESWKQHNSVGYK